MLQNQILIQILSLVKKIRAQSHKKNHHIQSCCIISAVLCPCSYNQHLGNACICFFRKIIIDFSLYFTNLECVTNMKLKADRRKPMHNTKFGTNTLYLSKSDPKRKLKE